VLRAAIYTDRVNAPIHELAQRELTRLEINPKDMTVDHPPSGSKDVADAMAGVAYGLTQRREIWVAHRIPMSQIPKYLTNPVKTPKDSVSYMENLKKTMYLPGGENRNANS
jgi:hypothetical protein